MTVRLHRCDALCLVILTTLCGCGQSASNPTATGGTAGSGGGAGKGGAQSGAAGTGGARGGSTGSGGVAGSAGGASGASGAAGARASGGNGGTASVTQRRVFVSSKTFVPTFGSLENADKECQTLADGEKLGGTWRAWLSDSSASPSTRFVKSTLPYVLVGGAQIAADWTDLTDGTIAVPIDHDETGKAIDASVTTKVWTATGADGAATYGNCSDWMTTASGAGYGSTTGTDATWSIVTGNTCNNLDRLYCFEQ